MSETPPIPPAAERPAGPKRRPIMLWLACSGIIVLVAYLFVMPFAIGGVPPRKLNSAYIGMMKREILLYAHSHEDHLPPTLWTLIPECLSEGDFDALRYVGEKKGERFDWLYFPKENYDGLPPDTILLAAPSTTPDTAGVHRRLVLQALWEPHRIPEADFQRLIREQNPPAASSSSAPAP